jgi:hypothetical protein
MFFSGHNPLASVPQTNPHVSIIEAYCWVYQYATIWDDVSEITETWSLFSDVVVFHLICAQLSEVASII